MEHMSFWDGEKCEYCGGPIVDRHVSLHRKIKDQYILIEHVPAGVCKECGTRYFAANVLKSVEESIHGNRPAEREVVVPVYAL
jgi:YgiT-type zinc finger domain-containing protein